jgi:hypothetical protein
MNLTDAVRTPRNPATPHPASLERQEVLLLRIAAQVAGLDGSRPGGALLGPRLFFLPALSRLPDGRLLNLGTAVELLLRATLVHRAPKREETWRGEGDTPFSQTLLGDTLLAESFRLLAADGEPRAVNLLSRAMADVAAGEMERHAGDAEAAIHRRAAYYEGAGATGALLAGFPPELSDRYAAWSRAIGERHDRLLAGLPVDAGLPAWETDNLPALAAIFSVLGTADVAAAGAFMPRSDAT